MLLFKSYGDILKKKAGTAKITATYKNIKFVCEVTVKPTVSVNKTKLSFAADDGKKAVTVTFKESGSVYWEIVKGSDIIDCEWSRKWKNDTTKLYIKPDGDNYGQARVKIYAEDKPSACTYIDVVVEPPISLKVVNKLPCIVGNYESRDYYDEGEKESKVKITNVDYEVLYGDSLSINVEFTAHDSYYDEGYYYFTYRVLDEDGYVVEFDRVMSERMYRGDKSKEEIMIFDLDDGKYTIEFLDHYAND